MRTTKERTAVWTLANDTESGRGALSVSVDLELATFLGGHYEVSVEVTASWGVSGCGSEQGWMEEGGMEEGDKGRVIKPLSSDA